MPIVSLVSLPSFLATQEGTNDHSSIMTQKANTQPENAMHTSAFPQLPSSPVECHLWKTAYPLLDRTQGKASNSLSPTIFLQCLCHIYINLYKMEEVAEMADGVAELLKTF